MIFSFAYQWQPHCRGLRLCHIQSRLCGGVVLVARAMRNDRVPEVIRFHYASHVSYTYARLAVDRDVAAFGAVPLSDVRGWNATDRLHNQPP